MPSFPPNSLAEIATRAWSTGICGYTFTNGCLPTKGRDSRLYTQV